MCRLPVQYISSFSGSSLHFSIEDNTAVLGTSRVSDVDQIESDMLHLSGTGGRFADAYYDQRLEESFAHCWDADSALGARGDTGDDSTSPYVMCFDESMMR